MSCLGNHIAPTILSPGLLPLTQFCLTKIFQWLRIAYTIKCEPYANNPCVIWALPTLPTAPPAHLLSPLHHLCFSHTWTSHNYLNLCLVISSIALCLPKHISLFCWTPSNYISQSSCRGAYEQNDVVFSQVWLTKIPTHHFPLLLPIHQLHGEESKDLEEEIATKYNARPLSKMEKVD